MARKKISGTCHICGSVGKLSFEHVPPRAAFNHRKIRKVRFDDAVKLGPDEIAKGPIEQRGAGAYTLCEACNNNTGAWYAKDFVSWCYQGAHVLVRTGFEPRVFTLHYLFPLRIIKQVITMFFSVNSSGLREANPDLETFVLSKNRRYLPPKYGFYVYFSRGRSTDRLRYNGIAAMATFDGQDPTLLSEITFPPFGYLMTIDSPPPDRRLLDITHFTRYGYNDFAVMELRPPVLDTPTYFHGDYRTPKEVREQAANSMAQARIRSSS